MISLGIEVDDTVGISEQTEIERCYGRRGLAPRRPRRPTQADNRIRELLPYCWQP